jgi:hypothetical protein
MEMNGQLHTLVALSPGKEPPQYPLNRKQDGSCSWSGCCGEETNSWPCLELKPNSLVIHLVAWVLTILTASAPNIHNYFIINLLFDYAVPTSKIVFLFRMYAVGFTYIRHIFTIQ